MASSACSFGGETYQAEPGLLEARLQVDIPPAGVVSYPPTRELRGLLNFEDSRRVVLACSYPIP